VWLIHVDQIGNVPHYYGSLLTLAAQNQRRLPVECIVRQVNGQDIVSVDWVHSEVPLVGRLQQQADLRSSTADQIKEAFFQYSAQQTPPQGWVDGTSALLDFATDRERPPEDEDD